MDSISQNEGELIEETLVMLWWLDNSIFKHFPDDLIVVFHIKYNCGDIFEHDPRAVPMNQ